MERQLQHLKMNDSLTNNNLMRRMELFHIFLPFFFQMLNFVVEFLKSVSVFIDDS